MSLYYQMIFFMKTGSPFILDQAEDYFQTDLIAYSYFIEKLIYLACKTRPDIVFIMEQLSWHNSDAQISHFVMLNKPPNI